MILKSLQYNCPEIVNPKMHFVSSSIYHKAKRLAIKEGMPVDQIKSHQAFSEIQQRSKYIPINLLYDIYEWATQNLTPGFSIRQGKQLNSDDYGTLGLSWKTSWTAHEILDRLERFMVLVTDHGRIKIEENRGFTNLIIFRDAGRPGVEIANEVSFVMLVGILTEVTGTKIRPTKICFKHAERSPEDFVEYFECPVE